MADQPASSWPYWRDKKGAEDAINDYFPDTLKNSIHLQFAVSQMRGGALMADDVFSRLADQELDFD